jgi:DNA recombination protein RmuC
MSTLEILLLALLVTGGATLALVAVAIARATRPPPYVERLEGRLTALDLAAERAERAMRDELARGRGDALQATGTLRTDLVASLDAQSSSLRASVVELSALLQARLVQVQASVESLTARNEDRLTALATASEQRLETLRTSIEARLGSLQRENAERLEQMRLTVDEKLQATLERRLGESFRQVSERLEQVHRGLGEMQSLATGVGDLKKVLANVKARGTWGEVQLRTLLEQGLAPDQFVENAVTRDGSAERVEFAIKLPGRDVEAPTVLLPVDAKFPLEDYQRLVDALEAGDAAAVEAAGAALDARVRAAARDIRDKYVNPPRTTDFALLFLPTEGLYAEVLRRPALVEKLQRDYRVVVAGPTTLWALINSLQMGFRTLAIERRSSEVWELLGRVKTDFARFGDSLAAIQKKLQEASNKIDEARRGSRRIERTLRDVQALPSAEVPAALPPLLERLEGEP